ncbi:MAG TPA: nitroreductase family protein, partial [Bacteroidales bacterium]|nr:nitroreductase family protein [Bacteroidales bacterium]
MKSISDILLQRKTIRKYSDRPLDGNLLHDILEKGCRASTTGNMQVYSVIITRDADMKRNLLQLHFNQ